ncbi:MAG: hypothetical protein HQM09_17385 [Candidatus Riflebacteria bacterium]|nr:hypothetical protein [Candidatus Riflebacteria bacterium]
MRIFSKKNGYLSGYTLVILAIILLFLGSMFILSADVSTSNRYAIFEAQAVQAADSGLDICLLQASATSLSSFSMIFPGGVVGSITISYALDSSGLASSTAYLYDRNNRLMARRTVNNHVDFSGHFFKSHYMVIPIQ